MNKYLIYLDNCCFNRPFDDLTSITVFLEAEAKLTIQNLVKHKHIDLVWSYIIEYENSANPSFERRKSIQNWKTISKTMIFESDSILINANEYSKYGLGIKDSLHLACAIESHCDFFITTDKGIIKKDSFIKEIQIVNPINFIQFIEDKNEN